MDRRQRLMSTLKGEHVDRPAVNFYEINGFEPTEDRDPFNVFSHPSWKPLVEIARDRTDRIVMQGVPFKSTASKPPDETVDRKVEYDERGSCLVTLTVKAGRRTLTCRTRRDTDMNTTWTLEHLLKDTQDVETWLELPEAPAGGEPDVSGVLETEAKLGDSGIVMLETGDPICSAAALFEMGTYMVFAFTERELFRRVLDRFASEILPHVEAIAKALPGRLWRICGPEYASPPYLPPDLFREYVAVYDRPIVDAIQRYGGFARMHSHGRLKVILGDIASTGCSGLDPIEPPPQGDVELSYVRGKYGKQLVLFGNIEVSELENLSTDRFEKRVIKAVEQGTTGEGRGFVLMPTACPCGRVLPERTLKNYETMVDVIERS